MAPSLLFIVACIAFFHSATALSYQDALTKSILYFEGVRSGKLPHNQRVTWRSDSGLTDGHDVNVDLTGGYYDSGDNVKFGFPLAFTSTLLSWSVLEYHKELAQAGELKHAKGAVRWASDYLLKAFQPPHTLWVQVGEPQADHNCWERPEDMDTPRTAYKVDPSAPGSDVAGETAAALAAAAMVFRKNTDYAQRLISAAEQLFAFADQYRGSYSQSVGAPASKFYSSYGYKDELVWGAAWLYLATNKIDYLNYVLQNRDSCGGAARSPLSWDNKVPGIDVLLAREYLLTKNPALQRFVANADTFVCSMLQAPRTPGGLYVYIDGDNLQYVTSTAFLLLTYSKYQTQTSCGPTTALVDFAKSQVDYILGNNPKRMSYMVGFGTNYPQRVHHRGASLPSVSLQREHIPCLEGFNWLHTYNPNPNVLVGAVVGGPDRSDNYGDKRDDPGQSEASTYTNAGLVGALAHINALYGYH